MDLGKPINIYNALDPLVRALIEVYVMRALRTVPKTKEQKSPGADIGTMENLKSMKETAEFLGMSLHWLKHDTKIPYIKIGSRRLYQPDDLRAFIASRRMNG